MAEKHDPELTRFRVYTLRGSDLRLVAETGESGVGMTLRTLYEDGEFESASIGLLDRLDPSAEGSWIVNPYTPVGGSR